jgi:phospholipid-binding lipoprotein MlaA
MFFQLTKLNHYLRLLILVAPIVITSCANRPLAATEKRTPPHQTEEPAVGQRSDPLEPFNRLMWELNYRLLDPLLLRPMAVIWHHCLPHPLRQGIGNVLGNLDEVPIALNYLLQAQLTQSLRHLARFAINTIGGLGGLIDIASYSGLPKTPRYTLGHVLGYYQVSHGPYLVVPAYGSTTPRQLLGQTTEQLYYFPLSALTLWGRIGKGVLEGIEKRAQLLSQEALLNQSSDSYLNVREIYFQSNDFIIKESSGEQEKESDLEQLPEALDQLD